MYHPSKKTRKNLILDLLGYYDIKQVITDIARKEADLDTLKAGASLISVEKITKVPKVVKAIGNVGKTGSKKGKEGEKIAKSGQAKQIKAKNKGGSGSRPKHLDSNPQKLKLEDFTKEVLETKPRNSPVPEKWYERGGEISIDKDGVWIYKDWKGNVVRYPNGYPDFKEAGMMIQEVPIGPFQGRNKDFKKVKEMGTVNKKIVHGIIMKMELLFRRYLLFYMIDLDIKVVYLF